MIMESVVCGGLHQPRSGSPIAVHARPFIGAILGDAGQGAGLVRGV